MVCLTEGVVYSAQAVTYECTFDATLCDYSRV